MTKNDARRIKEHDGRKCDAVRKPVDARASQRTGGGLTCNEAQVEDLLSEGEST